MPCTAILVHGEDEFGFASGLTSGFAIRHAIEVAGFDHAVFVAEVHHVAVIGAALCIVHFDEREFLSGALDSFCGEVGLDGFVFEEVHPFVELFFDTVSELVDLDEVVFWKNI